MIETVPARDPEAVRWLLAHNVACDRRAVVRTAVACAALLAVAGATIGRRAIVQGLIVAPLAATIVVGVRIVRMRGRRALLRDLCANGLVATPHLLRDVDTATWVSFDRTPDGLGYVKVARRFDPSRLESRVEASRQGAYHVADTTGPNQRALRSFASVTRVRELSRAYARQLMQTGTATARVVEVGRYIVGAPDVRPPDAPVRHPVCSCRIESTASVPKRLRCRARGRRHAIGSAPLS